MVVKLAREGENDEENLEVKDMMESRKRKLNETDIDEEAAEVEEEEEEEGKEHKTEKCELIRLQKLIPTMSIKDNVTQLDIILEAIRYIDSLREKLDRGMEM
eukprot:TRINITY_DN7113_c0_g1_i2.p2 TRINITY_DN7113_c0_g1~~TRINITY_DN7113_c0_g1_i2.p2  ORF type:complete len:113 (-),score=56.70 TRINITY_DN7113_c0_g1_i2:122-427(-)